MKNNGAAFFVLITHEAAVLEVGYESGFPLYARVGYLAFLFRIEFLPFLVVELLIELLKGLKVHKIDERIANVAFVFKVDWKIKEIVVPLVALIHRSQQHFLAVLVRDVFYHQCGALIGPLPYAFDVEDVLRFVLLLRFFGLLRLLLSRGMWVLAWGVGVAWGM